MEDVTKNARQMYGEYRYGRFNYGDKRERFEPLLFKLLGNTSPDTVLIDVGCGRGYWFDAYMRTGVRMNQITGIDLAPANVSELQAMGFNAQVGNLMDVPIDDRVSDFTVCIGVINCIDDPFKGFQELVRITKPGGTIYVNVYNKFHPYYYLVHKATFPLRYLYWNWSKKVADVAYWFAQFAFQPLAYLVFGKFLDNETGKTMFMDQVITPRAHLFTKSMLNSYASKCECTITEYRYNRYFLMLSAAIRVNQ